MRVRRTHSCNARFLAHAAASNCVIFSNPENFLRQRVTLFYVQLIEFILSTLEVIRSSSQNSQNIAKSPHSKIFIVYQIP